MYFVRFRLVTQFKKTKILSDSLRVVQQIFHRKIAANVCKFSRKNFSIFHLRSSTHHCLMMEEEPGSLSWPQEKQPQQQCTLGLTIIKGHFFINLKMTSQLLRFCCCIFRDILNILDQDIAQSLPISMHISVRLCVGNWV